MARELDNHGLRRTGVTIIPDQERNILSADPARRAAGVDHMKWAVDCAAALGAEILCGPFYQPLGQFTGTGPTAEEQQRAADAHRAAAEYAAQAGIPLAVEALNRFECYFLNTLADTAAHVARVGHPNFHLMYDTFHANLEEKDPVGVIAEHLPLIKHVHVSENDRGAPGSGHVPWGRHVPRPARGRLRRLAHHRGRSGARCRSWPPPPAYGATSRPATNRCTSSASRPFATAGGARRSPKLSGALLVSTAPDQKVLERRQHAFQARNPLGKCAELLALAAHLGSYRPGSDDNGPAETDGGRDDGDEFG